MQLVERIQLDRTENLSRLCHRCKNLYNTGLFYIIHFRQYMRDATHLGDFSKEVQDHLKRGFKRKSDKWRKKLGDWKEGKRKTLPPLPSLYLNWYDAKWLLKDIPEYKCLPAQVSQNVLKTLHKNWKSFFNSIEDWKENPEKYESRPRPPSFLEKSGEFPACFNHQHIPKKKTLKKNKVLRKLHFPKKVNLEPIEVVTPFESLQQVRIVPKNDIYYLDLIYNHTEPYDLGVDKERIISIDIGLNNLACVVNNINLQPFAINGRPLKSINQYYNKQISKRQRILSKQMLSENKKKYQGKIYKKNGKLTKGFIRYNNKRAKKRLQQTQYMKKLTRKRNNKVKDYMHKASRYIVNWCIEHKIGTIIIGKNDKWKQRVNLGKKTNQSFVQLPFNMLIEKIDYKAELAGIKVKTTTEEYTSQTCFKCGLVDKTNRKHRGLYVCPDCEIEINADVNAAYNIMKKVFPNSIAVEGIEGTQLYPTLINLGKDS